MANLIVPQGQTVKSVPFQSMRVLEHFSALWGNVATAGWGIHCSRCGQDVTSSNGATDKVLIAKCGCQEYFCNRPDGV